MNKSNNYAYFNTKNSSGLKNNSGFKNNYNSGLKNKGNTLKNKSFEEPQGQLPEPQINMDLPTVTKEIEYLETLGFNDSHKGINPTFDKLLEKYKELSGTDYYQPPLPVPPVATLTSPPVALSYHNGKLYIAQAVDNRVQCLDIATGTITPVAGNGTRGFSERGSATSVALNDPRGVAVDDYGKVFIADTGNQRIRAVGDYGNGTLVAVVGTGERGFNRDGGPGRSVNLNNPLGLAVDNSGNLFIADTQNHRIRRMASDTGMITTVAGTGENSEFDENGNLIFNGDGGPATSARLNRPSGVAVDGSGNLFIADTLHGRIRRVAAGTGIITTVAGNGAGGFSGDGGPAIEASFTPAALDVDGSGNLFILTSGRIMRVDARTGIITTVAGNGTRTFSGDGGPATRAGLIAPLGVAVDNSGNIYIACTYDGRIRRVDARTKIIRTIAAISNPSSGGRRRRVRKTRKVKKSRRMRKN